jgi:hypothetical protein
VADNNVTDAAFIVRRTSSLPASSTHWLSRYGRAGAIPAASTPARTSWISSPEREFAPARFLACSPTGRNVAWYRGLGFQVGKEGRREPRLSSDGGRPSRVVTGAPALRGRNEAVQKRKTPDS